MAQAKLPQSVINQVREYKKILQADNLPVSGVYVFGSYAKGHATKDSDIDVAVVSPKFRSSWEALSYLYGKLPYGLGWLIEPIGFSPEDFENKYSTLVHEIKKHGIKV
ncbi:MAG: nucleotidyltransferase domain-containing protein [Patescibacteria group bacterium]|nr:nucleotidyltransferase domain-containing protein [Patescibacteria group bacterium]